MKHLEQLEGLRSQGDRVAARLFASHPATRRQLELEQAERDAAEQAERDKQAALTKAKLPASPELDEYERLASDATTRARAAIYRMANAAVIQKQIAEREAALRDEPPDNAA